MSSESDVSDYYNDWTCRILDKRYIAIKNIDHGAYACVWICYDLLDRKYYAIKIHNREDYKHGKKETRTYNELKPLKCDNIMNLVRSFDCVFDNTLVDDLEDITKIDNIEDLEGEICHCCVLELQQCSVYNLLKKYGYKNGLPIDFLISTIQQMLNGLNILHKNKFIHADFKPENILLCGISENNKKMFKDLDIENEILKLLNNKNAKLTDILNKKNTKNRNIFLTKLKNKIQKYISKDELDSQSDSSSDESIDLGSTDTEPSMSCSINSSDELDSSDFSDFSDCSNVEREIMIKVDDKSKIKISDMGTCITPTRLKARRIIQTEYYRSPELLLEMKYDNSSDIWALGCTIYEMLSGKILFNSDGAKGNENRMHLFLITQKLGNIPKEMIKESPKKEILYTKKMDRIKGINKLLPKIPNLKQAKTLVQDLEEILIEKNCSEKVRTQFIDLMLKLLVFDPKKRITAEEALQHHLFAGVD